MYGAYCRRSPSQGVGHNSINMGIQTYRPHINKCQNSISIGVDSGSSIGSSIEDSCGKGDSVGTGNISIGTRSGQYQHNPSIAIGYGVGSTSHSPQQPYSISIQNDGNDSIISARSLGFGAHNVPDLSEDSIYLGTGINKSFTPQGTPYQIHKNAIVLSTLNEKREGEIYPVSIKQMGKDNEGFYVDAIRVNPTKNVLHEDSIPLVYNPKTGEIYAKNN